MKTKLLIALLLTSFLDLKAQTNRPDLGNLNNWQVVNRQVESIDDGGKKGVRLNEAAGDGLLILKGSEFSNGTIEFDVKGRNVMQQSFVGFAFHIQDEKTYDAVYFRPFNFINADTTRRRRAVQYISHPVYTWDKLRKEHPGKYENKVNPVPQPEGWFHVRIVIDGSNVKVFVNNSSEPSLEIKKISTISKGPVGFWVGNGSDGSFSNLMIKPLKG